jgi:hypothetical protein
VDGSAHLVYVSIVGIDRIASWGYPKAKLQAEQIVTESSLPWTIRNGALLPPQGHTVGSRTWDQFLNADSEQVAAGQYVDKGNQRDQAEDGPH